MQNLHPYKKLQRALSWNSSWKCTPGISSKYQRYSSKDTAPSFPLLGHLRRTRTDTNIKVIIHHCTERNGDIPQPACRQHLDELLRDREAKTGEINSWRSHQQMPVWYNTVLSIQQCSEAQSVPETNSAIRSFSDVPLEWSPHHQVKCVSWLSVLHNHSSSPGHALLSDYRNMHNPILAPLPLKHKCGMEDDRQDWHVTRQYERVLFARWDR